MRNVITAKYIRRLTALAALILGFVVWGSFNANCTGAKTCTELYEDYDEANMNYMVAFESYFYESPTSCDTECIGQTPFNQCVLDCQQARHTTLGAKELTLFSKAGATCSPYGLDECAAARAAADQCMLDYGYFYDLPSGEERDAVFAAFSACRYASKVDMCQ